MESRSFLHQHPGLLNNLLDIGAVMSKKGSVVYSSILTPRNPDLTTSIPKSSDFYIEICLQTQTLRNSRLWQYDIIITV